MTEVVLFEGLDYDSNRATDHFFLDELRRIVTLELPATELLTYAYFRDEVVGTPQLAPLVEWFNGFSQVNTPLRWDRVVGLRLLLVAFIDAVGYDTIHRKDQSEYDDVASTIISDQIRGNLASWLTAAKLVDDGGADKMQKALARHAE
jgi:hypothetical protein